MSIELIHEDQLSEIQGGFGLLKFLDWAGRIDIGYKIGSYIYGAVTGPRGGGPDYVTDPFSIGARNGMDAMSDNRETFGGELLPRASQSQPSGSAPRGGAGGTSSNSESEDTDEE
jgi:hypothetical protein